METDNKILLAIRGDDNNLLVSIDGGGEITYGKNYSPDEAAKIFWQAMATYGSGD